ncbi:MAG: hypothetical protein NZM44_02405 [Candidatus Calescibacterium sp.]|nr:hypothetical protein [Candidatus Calescibacterium sp.]
MKWKKLNRIYEPISIDNYLVSHASNPLPIFIDENIIKIFFSGRDKNNRSSVGYFDFSIKKLKVIKICEKSIFNFGNENSFYSHGVSIGCHYRISNEIYILFMGWQIREKEHWRGDIGRIHLDNDLQKMKLNPEEVFMGSDKEDPISLSYPFVIFDDNQKIYRMWYGSTISWTSENGEMIHVIKYTTSKDGQKWKKKGLAVPYKIGEYQAFSRPCIIKDNKGYHMWYSYRGGNGQKYKIGYAFSNDGQFFEPQHHKTGISTSKEGWDSEMICYPYVFDFNGERYMLYNGNGYGKTGIGIGILERD